MQLSFLLALAVAAATLAIPNPRALNEASQVDINQRAEFTSPSNGTHATVPLAKRTVFMSGGRTDYCGEANPTTFTDASQPMAADCLAIAASAASSPGFYAIPAVEFGVDGDQWVKIAVSGTCAFAVRPLENAKGRTLLMGSNDVRFYTEVYSRGAIDGRVGAVSGVACFNGEGVFGVEWGLIHA